MTKHRADPIPQGTVSSVRAHDEDAPIGRARTSGIRRIGDDGAGSERDRWLDRQFRLTVDLLHLQKRVASASLGPRGRDIEARRLVDRLEEMKDALYEIAADAIAPPLEPLLTGASRLAQHVDAMHAWIDDVMAWLRGGVHGVVAPAGAESVTPPRARAELPSMTSMLHVVEELHETLGGEHPMLERAKTHLTEAYMVALSIEADVHRAGDRDAGASSS